MEEKITRKEFFKQLSMMGVALLATGSIRFIRIDA
jgi:hypothetical protein